jgi:hypothetical protein
MVRLRRIPAIRAANVLTLTIGIPYGIIALGVAILLSPWYITAAIGQQVSTSSAALQFLGALFGGWATAMLTIWIFVVSACGLYNLIAGRFGGIELEFTTVPPSS